ncbi:MAG: M20/M25/M40 family metallo-hydrolase [Candidatus Hydrogenedentes bacterium]|nr:M20/M25/M40 family metallo-hydrolase [Candidatus Hydrogenedentota bacterium]
MLNDTSLRACTQYVLDQTRHVIETIGVRPPGSAAERKSQEYIREELRASCDTEPFLEEFPVAPKAFMSFQPIMGALLLGAMVAYWFYPATAFLLSTLALFVYLTEFVQYREMLDVFFPKQISCNVGAYQRPAGEVKRRFIINAHPDGAYEWRYHYHWPKQFKFIILYSLASSAFVFATNVAAIKNDWSGGYQGVWLVVGLLQLLCVPALISAFFYTNFKVTVPGANDNLSGCFIALGVLKHMREAGVQLQHTELGVLITGSEEAALRGAKAFARKHPRDFDDVETIFITLDTFRDLEHFMVVGRDLNALVRHDRAVCELLQNAGDAAGHPLPLGKIPLGASDAAAFTQGGYRAAALAAMDPAPADFYHTRRDNWDNMNPECIRACVEVVVEAIRQYDEKGLPFTVV